MDGHPAGLRPTGSVSSAGSEPSNHEATAYNLQARGIQFVGTNPQPVPNLQECSAAFWAALPESNQDSEGDYADLVKAVAKQYESGQGTNQGETAFDIHLFGALKSYLGDDMVEEAVCKTVSGKDQLSIIVLKGQWKFGGATYALGFSRQVTSDALRIPKHFGCSRTSRHDHSCVLLKKQGNERKFRVIETSATVELKTINKTCHLYTLRYEGFEDISIPLLDGRDGALSQVLAYTVSDVWTCLARRGMKIGDTPPDRVRFGILACRLLPKATGEEEIVAQTEAEVGEQLAKKQNPTTDPTWWALGDVIIPEVCGGQFNFEVTSFGSFESSRAEEATAAYLSVLTQGLQLLTSLKTKTSPDPYPLSGKDLMFGVENVETKSLLQYTSPFTDAKSMTEVGQLILQGEFWRGTISTKDLREMCQQPDEDEVCVVDKGRDVDMDLERAEPLLIKVSSRPVFNSLVDPGESFNAIKKLEKKKQLSALKKVLIAVWPAPQGLVTIMRDQERLGYVDLCPKGTETLTIDLWKNFMELARNQLLPLARAGVIHADIRVGYDYTANIMAKPDGSDMVLVDFESLVLFRNYSAPGSDRHGRYVPTTKNAFAFVCLQCYVVAVFWSEKRNQLVEDTEKQARSVVLGLKNALKRKDVGEADVETLLREITSQLGDSGRLDTRALRDLFL